MSSNKAAKEELIRRYGAKCFIERLGLRDTSGLKYTGKAQYKKMKMLTYHHIREKSKGGKATRENGALLSAENHAWFHQQDRADRERMNQMFQELKRNIDNNYEPCEVQLVSEEELEQENGEPFELHIATGSFESDAKMQPKFKPHTAKKKKYNRARNKRKTKRIVKRYYGGER